MIRWWSSDLGQRYIDGQPDEGDGGVGKKMKFVGGEVLQAPLSNRKETRKMLEAVYVDDDVVVVGLS